MGVSRIQARRFPASARLNCYDDDDDDDDDDCGDDDDDDDGDYSLIRQTSMQQNCANGKNKLN